MWKYIRKYLLIAILAAMCMIGEVLMDLIQPGIMRRIVDDGVPGLNNGDVGDMHLIWTQGLVMVGLGLLGGLFGGAVTTEATFALPGVAQLSVQAIRNNDYELVTGCSIMTTTIVTVFMVLLDIFVAYIDPRVKAQYSK